MYLLPLFDPTCSVAVVVCPPNRADGIALALSEQGFDVERRTAYNEVEAEVREVSEDKGTEEAARTGECTPSLAPDSDEEEGSLVTPASEVQEEDADGMARIADVDIAEKLAGLVLGGLEDQIQEACEDAGVCGFELHTIAQA